MKEGTLVQVHNNEALDDCRSISKPWSSSLYEDLACTLLRGLPPSFHTLVVSLRYLHKSIIYGVNMWKIIVKIIAM